MNNRWLIPVAALCLIVAVSGCLQAGTFVSTWEDKVTCIDEDTIHVGLYTATNGDVGEDERVVVNWDTYPHKCTAFWQKHKDEFSSGRVTDVDMYVQYFGNKIKYKWEDGWTFVPDLPEGQSMCRLYAPCCWQQPCNGMSGPPQCCRQYAPAAVSGTGFTYTFTSAEPPAPPPDIPPAPAQPSTIFDALIIWFNSIMTTIRGWLNI